MFKNANITIFSFCALLNSASGSTILAGSDLNIGYANTFQGETGAIGHHNNVAARNSLAVGIYNSVENEDNTQSALVVGMYNTTYASCVIALGSYNIVSQYASGSLTAGYGNYNDAPNSLVVGEGNVTAVGPYRNAIVAGKYNAPVNYNKPVHLVVGNGTGPSDRKNSFIVYQDGDVVITKPQGDISMGIYGDQ